MWAIIPKVWPLKCAWVHGLRDTEKSLICTHTNVHTQLGIILGCGPNANLKSTNTHGTEQGEKETGKGEAIGYYAWTEILCCCIWSVDWAWLQTQRGPRNVSLIGPKWNKVQMALIDNIRLRDTFQFVLLSICVRLSRSHTFFSCPLLFYISNPLHSPAHLSTHFSFTSSIQETIMSSVSSSFLTSLTPHFVTTVFPVITFLSPTLLLTRPEPWHSTNTIFQWTFKLKGYLKDWNCAWGGFQQWKKGFTEIDKMYFEILINIRTWLTKSLGRFYQAILAYYRHISIQYRGIFDRTFPEKEDRGKFIITL